MKKVFLFLILGIFLFSSVSALDSLGTGEKNECFRIKQMCSSCSYVNISSVTYPNSTVAVSNIEMTSFGNGEWYYDFCLTNINGRYDVGGQGDINGIDDNFATYFLITPTGAEFGSPEATLYIAIIIGLIIFLIVTIYGAIAIPYRNERNDDGKIISVNDKKYLKILSIFASYGILTWLANIMISISNNYIDLNISLTFFTIMFKLLISLLYPTLIFTIIFIAIQFVKDMKLNKMIDRGILG